jgi:hypothetical protein
MAMSWQISLVTAVILLGAGVSPAGAWERTLFDFRGEFPVGSGAVRFEASCAVGLDGLNCRAGGRVPTGQGFQFEGRFRSSPPDSPKIEKTAPPQNAPRWF